MIALMNLPNEVVKSNLSIDLGHSENKGNSSSSIVVIDKYDIWFLDGGANCHMIWNLNLLHDFRSSILSYVQIVDGNVVIAIGHNTAYISDQLFLKVCCMFQVMLQI